jgi:hypothetical protein
MTWPFALMAGSLHRSQEMIFPSRITCAKPRTLAWSSAWYRSGACSASTATTPSQYLQAEYKPQMLDKTIMRTIRIVHANMSVSRVIQRGGCSFSVASASARTVRLCAAGSVVAFACGRRAARLRSIRPE